MTTEIALQKPTYNNISDNTRLAFGVLLVGMMGSFTHGFYMDIGSVPTSQVAQVSAKELHTHTGSEFDGEHYFVDPRHIRGIRREEE